MTSASNGTINADCIAARIKRHMYDDFRKECKQVFDSPLSTIPTADYCVGAILVEEFQCDQLDNIVKYHRKHPYPNKEDVGDKQVPNYSRLIQHKLMSELLSALRELKNFECRNLAFIIMRESVFESQGLDVVRVNYRLDVHDYNNPTAFSAATTIYFFIKCKKSDRHFVSCEIKRPCTTYITSTIE